MAKPVQLGTKKPYSTPSLTIYGTVQDLTKAVGKRRAPDGGHFPKLRTAH